MRSEPAHPRWRGEHTDVDGNALSPGGSSPLARGAPGRHRHQLPRFRLIPAGAGSTRTPPAPTTTFPAHPRWRGEHPLPNLLVTRRCGSSPLARGAHRRTFRFMATARLIPAGAGSTDIVEEVCNLVGVVVEGCVVGSGSSPLARGARTRWCAGRWFRRLIPAGAGSTYASIPRSRVAPAHPRWRGEHYLIGENGQGHFGSSPLARGARNARPSRCGLVRLIPAGAGSTYAVDETVVHSQAHPRWRGEHMRGC